MNDILIFLAQSFSPVMTRVAGRQRFVNLTMSVPGDWTVERSHELASEVERGIAEVLPGAITFTHVEPMPREHAG